MESIEIDIISVILIFCTFMEFSEYTEKNKGGEEEIKEDEKLKKINE